MMLYRCREFTIFRDDRDLSFRVRKASYFIAEDVIFSNDNFANILQFLYSNFNIDFEEALQLTKINTELYELNC